MLKIEKTDVAGWEAAVRGMRNAKNSWALSDSVDRAIGENDERLMRILFAEGTPNRKFMRMLVVWCDITAPLYWWKEFDTYKVGTVRNSCSTMHKLTAKPFEMSDFSFEDTDEDADLTDSVIVRLNELRDEMRREKDVRNKKAVWRRMVQLLPSSYNQKATVMLSYETLANMYFWRKDHKLSEWHTFCDWVKTLPNSWIITGAPR